MALQDNWPIWGSNGSQPSDGKDYSQGDSPSSSSFDYLWSNIRDTFASVESRLSSVESDTSSNSSDISSLQSGGLDDRYYRSTGNDQLVVETRTSDPSDPDDGQIWIRTDQ